MTAGETLLDAFINANVLLMICLSFWFVLRAAMQHLGLRYAYGTQLRLLKLMFVVIALAPFIE
ncbi:MAG: biotin transporter BioY, partial [Litoreibacter sp.]|nr:biotin transporter BioY [Litoreibacter sp.]